MFFRYNKQNKYVLVKEQNNYYQVCVRLVSPDNTETNGM